MSSLSGKDGPRIEPALLEEASGWVAPAQGEAGLYWAALGKTDRAVAAYADDVRHRRFPGPAEIYFAKAV